MSGQKLLLPFGTSTILEQAADNLLNSKVDELIVVVGYRAEEVIEKIAKRPVKLTVNLYYRRGMSTAIIAGLSSVDKKYKAVMVALADQPLINSKIIDKLIEEFPRQDKGVVVPYIKASEGTRSFLLSNIGRSS